MADVSRRSFLKRSAATVAAVGLAARGLAAEAVKPLRLGIIGAGHRGSVHINSIKTFAEKMQILGVCDVMDNHLAAGMKRAGESAVAYTDYQKLLANRDIDAVLIATPNLLHREMVLAALQAGKHVMCEKPMAVNFEECKATKAAVESSKQIVLFTMQLRYSAHYQELRKAIEAGKIGKPKFLTMQEFRGDWNRGDVWKFNDPKLGEVNWRFSHAASGGTLSEKVCHYFDILHWMVGEHPSHVMCDGGIAKYDDGRDTWDHATTTMRYPSGALATHSLCMFGPSRLDLQVIGDEASITVGKTSLTLQAKGKSEELKSPEEILHGERGPEKGIETAVVKMCEDFLDCVRNNKKPWMDVDKAMTSSKTAWLGELSNEQKREVKWEDIM